MWSPPQTLEVWIFPIHQRASISFVRFALSSARFFVLPLQLLVPLSIALGQRRFSWSCDGALLDVQPRLLEFAQTDYLLTETKARKAGY